MAMTHGGVPVHGAMMHGGTELLPAMQSVYNTVVAFGLQGQVNVTTTHSLDIMGSSYAVQYIQPLLNFLSMARSPFLFNCYPYVVYKADPGSVPLEYVLFPPNAGVTDPNTKLNYDNMLYNQIDTVYAAMPQALSHTDVDLKIFEALGVFGWVDEPIWEMAA
ncbi:glucan endo-1,3-beta-glucosidase 14-like [Oryza glaberrima]|uniref:glucan endo-1,3-beta-glucosidase 14-like n=1 Tax=Oryza glaberrima TaxID=4538 RepID=UPI00224C5F60|nr:glucan endo-1,3-beta-glucosidase 14-like [Oryza glaberrima]